MRRTTWLGATWLGANQIVRAAFSLIIVCGLVGVCLPSVATAADETGVAEALKLIPDEALGAAVINNLADLDAKIVKLAAKFNLPHGDGNGPLPTAKKILGIQDGLDDKGTAVLVVLPPISENATLPFVALAMPVTDYQKFVGSFASGELEDGFSQVFVLGQNLWAIQRQNFAWMISPRDFAAGSDEEVQEVRKKIKKLLVDRPAEVSKAVASSQEWLAKQDIGLIATTSGVKMGTTKAREAIQQMKVMFDQIANMQLGDDQEQAAAMRRQMQMARQGMDLYDAMFTWVEKEVSTFVAGIRIDQDDTLRLAKRLTLKADGTWKEFAAKLPKPATPPLAGLPGGPYMGAFEGVFAGGGSSFLTDYSMQMLKMSAASGPEPKLTDDDWKRLSEAMAKSMEGVESMSMLVGVPQAGQSLYGTFAGYMKVEDSAKYLDNYAASIAAFKEISQATNNPFLGKYDSKMIEIGGTKAVEVTIDMSGMVATMEKQGPGMKAYFEMLVGPGGKQTVYIQPVDKNTVVMAWLDKANLDRAKAALKNPAAGLASDAGVKTTMALLPKGSQWTLVVNPSGVMQFAGSMMQAFGAQGIKLPELGEMPPVAFTAKLGDDGLEAEFVVPGATLEAAAKRLHPQQ